MPRIDVEVIEAAQRVDRAVQALEDPEGNISRTLKDGPEATELLAALSTLRSVLFFYDRRKQQGCIKECPPSPIGFREPPRKK